MRILDQTADRSLDRIILFLTKDEARELKDSLEAVISENIGGRHEHVSSDDYRKEVTICIYDSNSLEGFNGRSQKLIREDV